MRSGTDDPAVVLRCREAVDAVASGARRPDDLASFVADLGTLPVGHPRRGEFAATVITLLVESGLTPPMDALGDLSALLDMVDTAPPHLLTWPQCRAVARVFQLAHEVRNRKITTAEAAAETKALALDQAESPRIMAAVRAFGSVLKFDDAVRRDDQSTKMGLTKPLEELVGRMNDHSRIGPLRDLFTLMRELLGTEHTGDWDAVPGTLAKMRDAATALGVDPGLFTMSPQAEALFDSLRGDPSAAAGMTADEVARRFTSGDTGVAGKLAAVFALVDGGTGTDVDRIDRAVQLAREAAAEPGEVQDLARNLVGILLWRRAEVLSTTDGLDEAQQVLEDLVHDLRGRGGTAHLLWTDVNALLAAVKRRLGDQPGSAEAGREAMFRFAHRALLESDPGAARHGLREAATQGMDLARQLVVIGDYAGAMNALDTGRGLMLFAEVEIVDLGPRLRSAGRDDLARRWEVEGPTSPGLRAEAIDVLVANAGGIDKLLRPPVPADVRAALRAVDADALVYLVPADRQQPGMALVVPRDRPMAYLPLPYLDMRREAGIEGYLAALSELSRELSPAARAPFTDRLDELCEWSWKVAIRPLLERYFAQYQGKRVPRIVLIPMGELAAVPWQAARDREGTYAIESAAFSQAASAREFCANAARSPVRLTSTGLVVGDPDTAGRARDLPAARLEAFEVHKAFLPAAKYVGRRPNGTSSPSKAGTVEQVRAWLASDSPYAGAVLHLACHGQFTSDEQVAKASLLLAPDGADDPGELRADEIVRLLHDSPNRRIGLVVMAACHTGRSIHGYDEAYSLGTAFLAAGVRTVLSTQWAVPDEATSMLMYLFHHYLRTEKLAPWQALRAAQLVMLRPDTTPPDAMPAHLRDLVRGRRHAGVVGWAGFVHGGH